MKRTPIGKAKRRPIQIRQRSEKRQQQIQDEVGIRIALEARCKGRCEECHKRPDWRGLQLSHTIPKSRGGKTSQDNCQLLCGCCHSSRHGIKEV